MKRSSKRNIKFIIWRVSIQNEKGMKRLQRATCSNTPVNCDAQILFSFGVWALPSPLSAARAVSLASVQQGLEGSPWVALSSMLTKGFCELNLSTGRAPSAIPVRPDKRSLAGALSVAVMRMA